RGWNASLARRLRSNPLLRLGVHPPDFRFPALWRQIERLAEAARAERDAITYADWLAAAHARQLGPRIVRKSHADPVCPCARGHRMSADDDVPTPSSNCPRGAGRGRRSHRGGREDAREADVYLHARLPDLRSQYLLDFVDCPPRLQAYVANHPLHHEEGGC